MQIIQSMRAAAVREYIAITMARQGAPEGAISNAQKAALQALAEKASAWRAIQHGLRTTSGSTRGDVNNGNES